jgi:hypothetical protein
MHSQHIGLTTLYNAFHNPEINNSEICDLRLLHEQMDKAVLAAYRWGEIHLNHGFYETQYGIRFTISDAAQQELFERLLILNHQRHAEEEAEGAPAQKKSKIKRGRKKSTDYAQSARGLFNAGEGDQ